MRKGKGGVEDASSVTDKRGAIERQGVGPVRRTGNPDSSILEGLVIKRGGNSESWASQEWQCLEKPVADQEGEGDDKEIPSHRLERVLFVL